MTERQLLRYMRRICVLIASSKTTKSSSRYSNFVCAVMVFLFLLVISLIIIVVLHRVHKNTPEASLHGICNTSNTTDELTSDHRNELQCNKLLEMYFYMEHLKNSCISKGGNAGMDCLLCPVGWLEHLNKCYYISKENKTWDDSKNFCHLFEAHLVIIENSGELDFLQSKMIPKEYTYWIGLWKPNTFDGWTWLDGTPLDIKRSPFKIVLGLSNRHACISKKHITTAMQKNRRMWICEREAVPV
ncbi:natural killer cells antigen CD94-like isoform X2 [Polypterus senegalus]|uniref:natural killer cells antigen CD94-like isoform X2 n=1 Tax=Polypterus senegalus TaxID=55291 RepID=UPI001966BF2C|nr:natural killer cells antigen CD94-like isoform X2 [Polypterus senegalus]